MSENQNKILQMLADGKIGVEEAEKLLALVGSEKEDTKKQGNADGKPAPRFLRLIVEPREDATSGHNWHNHGKHRVNIRVPFGLIRAGVKLASIIPSDTAEHMDKAFKEKGFNFDVRHMKEEDIDEILAALRDNEIDIDSEQERVRIYAE